MPTVAIPPSHGTLLYPQPLLDLHNEIIIDLFAGGGGASSAIEETLGRPVDIAINHDAAAVAMHAANHPQTQHYISDVFEVDPRIVTQGRPIGLLWASPDCTYHSKARGKKPIRSANRKRRALAWVVTRWAGQVRPRVIMLENVEEFAKWGPLVGKPDNLRPCRRRQGRSFRKWVKSLADLGYQVEWKELRACDYGAPTIRKRLFLIARCDGRPIEWPTPTHAPRNSEAVKTGKLLPWPAAGDCIDWSHPMLSIFATKAQAKEFADIHGLRPPIRPLADATDRRNARGVKRFVLDDKDPYLALIENWDANRRNTARSVLSAIHSAVGAPMAVTLAHGEDAPNGSKRWGTGSRSLKDPHGTVACSNDTAIVSPFITPITHHGERSGNSAHDPLVTITTAHRGELGLVAPYMVQRYGERKGQKPRTRSAQEPLPVIVPDNNQGTLVAAHITKFHSGETGHTLADPLHTITSNSTEGKPGGAAPLGIVSAQIGTYYGEKTETDQRGGSLAEPLATIPTENRHAVVATSLSTYYGNEKDGASLQEPLGTQTAKDRHGVVASWLHQHNAGFYDERGTAGRSLHEPNATVCAEGSPQSVVALSMSKLRGTSTDADPKDPLDTVSAGGTHHAVVAAHLSHNNTGHTPSSSADEPLHTVVADGARHNVVAAHFQRDFGQSVGSPLKDPIGTITADRNGHAALIASFLEHHNGEKPKVDEFGFVVITLTKKTKLKTPWGWALLEKGSYYIEDICMRMLQPLELYLCQGFRRGYIIDIGADGKPLTKTEQVRMVGNSVSPPPASAVIRVNLPELICRKELIA